MAKELPRTSSDTKTGIEKLIRQTIKRLDILSNASKTVKKIQYNESVCSSRQQLLLRKPKESLPKLVPNVRSNRSRIKQSGPTAFCRILKNSSGTTLRIPSPSILSIRTPAVSGFRVAINYSEEQSGQLPSSYIYSDLNTGRPNILTQISYTLWSQLKPCSGFRRRQGRHVWLFWKLAHEILILPRLLRWMESAISPKIYITENWSARLTRMAWFRRNINNCFLNERTRDWTQNNL